jgi:hypothetical protein
MRVPEVITVPTDFQKKNWRGPDSGKNGTLGQAVIPPPRSITKQHGRLV